MTPQHLGKLTWKALAQLVDLNRDFLHPSWPDFPGQRPRCQRPPRSPLTGPSAMDGPAELLFYVNGRKVSPPARGTAHPALGTEPWGGLLPGLGSGHPPLHAGSTGCPSLPFAKGFARAPPPRRRDRENLSVGTAPSRSSFPLSVQDTDHYPTSPINQKRSSYSHGGQHPQISPP